MKILTGKQKRPQKIVLYGQEGVGKTTLASKLGNCVFWDFENSTCNFEVTRIYVKNYQELMVAFELDYSGFDTIVIDTVDIMEQVIIAQICKENKLQALGGQNDFGRSYNLLAGRFAEILERLSVLNKNLIFICHAKIAPVNRPDSSTYDSWSLKLEKKTNALIKEFSDSILFASYVPVLTQTGGKNKAVKEKRILRTEHNQCWEAKNRYNLSAEISLDDAAELLNNELITLKQEVKQPAEAAPAQNNAIAEKYPELWQKMQEANLTEEDIKIGSSKFYPAEVAVIDYPAEFIDGKILPHWNAFVQVINERKNNA